MLICLNFLFLLNIYIIFYYDVFIVIKKKECNILIKCVFFLVVYVCKEVECIVEKNNK